MNTFHWKIENNYMSVSFFHPSENTPEDPKADERFASEVMSGIQIQTTS